MIGSPSVFHTAPPHPASNARMTCSPLFAGGAEASQKGFGLLMPANSMLRSAMRCSVIFASPTRHQRARGVAAVGDGVHDLFAAIDAIAAGEHLRVARRTAAGVAGDTAAG